MLFIVKLGETVRADHPHCFGHRAKKCRWNVATSISLMQQYKQKCNGLLIYFLPNDLLYPKALTSLTQKIQLHLHLSTLLPVGMFNVSLSHEVNLHKHVVWRGSWKFWRLCMDVAIYVDIHIDICINIYIYIKHHSICFSHHPMIVPIHSRSGSSVAKALKLYFEIEGPNAGKEARFIYLKTSPDATHGTNGGIFTYMNHLNLWYPPWN